MKLANLINSISNATLSGEIRTDDIYSIEYDSRKVKKNSVFVALKGLKQDGNKYIQDALNNGALGVIMESTSSAPDELFSHLNAAKIVVNDARVALAEASNSFFEEPSKKLHITGITGTNGKTTTAYYLRSIYQAAGRKNGLLGTIANYIDKEKIEAKLTTPESNDLNELLQKMINAGCDNAVMEVSSHSLVLKRVHKIHFKSAIFTNISAEHLDFHSSFENYLSAKKILFDTLSENSFAIYNSDEIHNVDVLEDCISKKVSYGISEKSDFRITDLTFDLDGTKFNIKYDSEKYPIFTSLVGNFNAYNACAAFAAAVAEGVNPEDAITGIKNTKQVPGRFEIFGNGKRKIVVDFSHTPDSLEKALLVIKQITENKIPIYTVFGCGGNRDKQKRPLMGKIATELSSRVIITSDNPRDENPNDIIEEIKSGIEKNNYTVIENRYDAIKEAINWAKSKSVILIAGKGHEDYQEIKGKRNHFSDREVAENLLHS